MNKEDFLREVADRSGTVHDARRLSASVRDRLIAIEINDGDLSRSRLYGVFKDVVRDREGTFYILIRGLLPTNMPQVRSRHPARRLIARIPLSMVDRLPPALSFLLREPAAWPTSEASVACDICQYGSGEEEINAGRFCVACGEVLREGADRRYLSAGHRIAQYHARKSGTTCRRCGGGMEGHHAYCMKCGASD